MEMSHHVGQTVVDGIHPVGKSAVELSVSVAGAFGSLGIDQVNDRLGLRQVHASVEKGPAGELTGQRLTGAVSKQRLQTQRQHGGRAVALQLSSILSCVAVGTRRPGSQHLINGNSVFVLQRAVNQPSGRLVCQFATRHGCKDGRGDFAGLRPGKTQDADGTWYAGRGHCSDGFCHVDTLKNFVEIVKKINLDSFLCQPAMNMIPSRLCGKPCG